MTATAIEERVIRRFVPVTCDLKPLTARGDMLGLYVDTETLGLNPDTDPITQLAIVPFAFTANGNITGVGAAYSWYEDPGRAIPAEITALTGITDEMVRGKRIADGTVKQLVERAQIVVSHHSGFDRPFLERRLPVFENAVYGCSLADVPWLEAGFECRKLRCLMLEACDLDFDGHSADADCYAGLKLLGTTMESTSMRGLAYVLAAARVSHVRVYATGAPFEYKDLLKGRGYSWDAAKKLWHRDVTAGDEYQAEVEWLANNAMCHSPKSVQFTAKQRFSTRIGL